jgi:hypothetical protein
LLQLQILLDTFIQEQEVAVRHAAASSVGNSSSTTNRSAEVGVAQSGSTSAGGSNPTPATSAVLPCHHQQAAGDVPSPPALAPALMAVAAQPAAAGTTRHSAPADGSPALADVLPQLSNMLHSVDAAACPSELSQEVPCQQQQLDDQDIDEQQQQPTASLRQRWRRKYSQAG